MGRHVAQVRPRVQMRELQVRPCRSRWHLVKDVVDEPSLRLALRFDRLESTRLCDVRFWPN